MIDKLKYIYNLIAATKKKGKLLIVFYIVFVVINQLIDFAISILAPACIIAAFEADRFVIVFIPIIAISILFLLSVILDKIEGISICRIRADISKSISAKIFKKINSSDISQFDDASFYEKQILNMNSIEEKTFEAIRNLSSLLGYSILFLVNISLIFVVSVKSWIFIGMALCITMIVRFFQTRFNLEYNKKAVALGRRFDVLSRFFLDYDYAKEIKSKDRSDMLYEQIIIEKDNALGLYNRSRGFFSLYYFINLFSSTLILKVFFLIYLTYNCLVKKEISYVSILVVYNTAETLYNLLNNFVNVYSSYDDISLYAKNYHEIMRFKNKIVSGTRKITEFERLEFRNVCFRYPSMDKDVLHDLSFKIEKGQKIALVGRNGNGKSTLIMLLLRMYDPQKGEILVNGINIKEYSISDYRHFFGVIFQETALFNATIKENIGFGIKQNIDLNMLLDSVGMLERIQNLENKENSNYGVEIFNDGTVLSGGEQQRLLVARALAKNNGFLVMDEPTAHVDPMADVNFSSLIFDRLPKKTVLYITHRLISTKKADAIIVLDNKGEAEIGSHEDMLEQSELYRNMYESQLRSYRP